MDTLYLYWLLYATCSLILLTRQLYYQQKKKKAHMRNRSSNSNLTVFKAGNFPNFDTTCYTARVSVYNDSIPPFHTPPFYPWLKSEARLTRCVEEKLHGNTMADIDSLEFAIVPRDTIDEIEFHSRSFACDSAEDRHVLLAALTQRNLEIE